MNKEIVFIFPNTQGGVASFNRNIINFHTKRNNLFIRVILLDLLEDDRPRFTGQLAANQISIFKYSNYDKNNSVLKKLGLIIGENVGVAVVDSDLPIKAIRYVNSLKSIVYLVHDFYYIRSALENQKFISDFIFHSTFFRDIILSANIELTSRCHYIRYGVELSNNEVSNTDSEDLNLVFLGRLVESKGVKLLIDIDSKLLEFGIKANWCIIGQGELKNTFDEKIQNDKRWKLFSPSDTNEVYRLLEKQDLLVFPTKFEGTPVAIIEALSCGVVPIVSNLPGGVREVLSNKIGKLCRFDSADEFAYSIKFYHEKRDILIEEKIRCIKIAREHYDVRKNADRYISFISKSMKINNSNYDIILNQNAIFKLFKLISPKILIRFTKKFINLLKRCRS